MKKQIVLTGGGTAGHVAVNLALIPPLLRDGWSIDYIGSQGGIEEELIRDFPEVTYHAIPTGKFRRAKTLDNFFANFRDLFRIWSGYWKSRRLIKKIRPQIIFSKGGYVSVPVVYAGASLRVPVLSHESDLTPGLANKLTLSRSKKILITFKETARYLPKEKVYYLGPIIRGQIKGGSKERGLSHFSFDGKKPVLLVLGGSSGAARINEAVWENLDVLLETFDIVHGVGQGKGRPDLAQPGYVQVDYIKEEMKDALAMADLILSRAGSNAIFEFLYYQKPMVLIPYRLGSRGDQVVNAKNFADAGYANTLNELTLTREDFLEAVSKTWQDREEIVQREKAVEFQDGVQVILNLIDRYAKGETR